MPDPSSLGRLAYEAWCAQLPHETHPPWWRLQPRYQHAWQAMATWLRRTEQVRREQDPRAPARR